MQPKNPGAIAGAAAFANHLFSRRSLSITSLPILRVVLLVAIFTCAVSLTAISLSVAQNANADAMDRGVKPGDDFYRYANGGWLKMAASRAGQPTYDNRAVLTAITSQRVRDLIEEAATTYGTRGIARKVGDYYASLMNEDTIKSRRFKPLADEMAGFHRSRTKSRCQPISVPL